MEIPIRAEVKFTYAQENCAVTRNDLIKNRRLSMNSFDAILNVIKKIKDFSRETVNFSEIVSTRPQ